MGEQGKCAHEFVQRVTYQDPPGMALLEGWRCGCGKEFMRASDCEHGLSALRARVAELEAKLAESDLNRNAQLVDWIYGCTDEFGHRASNNPLTDEELAAATKRAGEEDRGL